MNCMRCKRKAVFELRYSGHWLCRKHFIELFERRVKKNIRQGKLIEKDDVVLVGLSGRKDSMVVLKILNDIMRVNPNCRLVAVSVDEGIRGKSLRGAIKYCESIGVEHRLVTFKEYFGLDIDDVVEKVESDCVPACSVCGVLKRRLLNDYADKIGATKVATGYNLDDEIQSAFMSILGGDLQSIGRLWSGTGVLRRRSFIPQIKVLRECPEEEVQLYAKLMKLPHTKSRCPYARTSYRTTVRDLLNSLEKNHPGSKYQMLRSSDEFAKIMGTQLGRKHPGECSLCGEPSSGKKCTTCQLIEGIKVLP
ncbi:MAG: TIGR00269 family protein [Candidatus Altiarchaeota archaeon]